MKLVNKHGKVGKSGGKGEQRRSVYAGGRSGLRLLSRERERDGERENKSSPLP